MPDVVAIQQGGRVAGVRERVLDGGGDGALAAAAQARKPQDAAALAQLLLFGLPAAAGRTSSILSGSDGLIRASSRFL